MRFRLRLLLVVACLFVPHLAVAEPQATLFRLFLLDGSALVSYGEYVRLENHVVLSMPVGGPADGPRLQVATLDSVLVDWPRTDRYAASVRYQQYAKTRGEDDFRVLSNGVANALNAIAQSTDRQKALELAESVRQSVAAWPQTHYGYRHDDIREIVSVLDQAISVLRAALGANPFELSLVALAQPPDLEPVLGMPTVREQLDQVFRVARYAKASSDRVALMQAALTMVAEAGAVLPASEQKAFRENAERQIRGELEADRRYVELSRRLMSDATRAAQRADASAVQQLVARIGEEDAKLGRSRPEVIVALSASLRSRLADARQLRLLRDQWTLRRPTYQQYQRSVNPSLALLVRSTSSLEAIRKLDGPDPVQLVSLRSQLSGGAERLQRMHIPEYLRDIHERLIGAWRFAENAAKARFEAVSSADATAAWEASSSAAGALMILARVQQDFQSLMEPPTLP